jgi:DNA-binding CsgD family transcriptional regulator
MILMPASILYVIGFSLRHGIMSRRRGEIAAADDRWKDFSRAATRVSAVFLPILLVMDFFPRIALSLGLRLPPYLKAFPLLYAIISFLYLAKTLPSIAGAGRDAGPNPPASSYGLSLREEEIATLLLAGLTYREIGEKLFISLSTVKTHIERIYRKTEARNKIELGRKLGRR